MEADHPLTIPLMGWGYPHLTGRSFRDVAGVGVVTSSPFRGCVASRGELSMPVGFGFRFGGLDSDSTKVRHRHPPRIVIELDISTDIDVIIAYICLFCQYEFMHWMD